MRTARIAVAMVVVGLCGTIALETYQAERAVDEIEMAEAARALLTSLSDAQRSAATFPFDSDERSRHHFIPTEVFERLGMVYRDMDSEQKVRALDLLRSGLSQDGYMTAQQIMEVEGILGILEGEGRQFSRDQEDYWVSVFGTPGPGSTWGWRWEGHHLSPLGLDSSAMDSTKTWSTRGSSGVSAAR